VLAIFQAPRAQSTFKIIRLKDNTSFKMVKEEKKHDVNFKFARGIAQRPKSRRMHASKQTEDRQS
jgi:hypothetical protein